MFRTQNNVPEIYVNESRDFQILGRILDLTQGATKYCIDSLRHSSNTLEMNSALLPLLKSKVGFFHKDSLEEDSLRYLLAGFPYLIRYKGSKKAIVSAVNLWLRVIQADSDYLKVEIINTDYSILISIGIEPHDTQLLDHILQYIVPTGYILKYEFGMYLPMNVKPTQLNSRLLMYTISESNNSKVSQDKGLEIKALADNISPENPSEELQTTIENTFRSVGTTFVTHNEDEGE